MYKFLIVLAVFFIPHPVLAQLLPKEGGKLHYRLIGFYDETVQEKKNTLEIAAGIYSSEDSFQKNKVLTRTDKKNKIIAEVPEFGKQYTWRVTGIADNGKKITGMLHHFSTTFIPDVDSTNTRLRITKNSGKYQGALVLLDGNRGIYDMKGKPVWYLPTINGLNNEKLRDVRDMKLTRQGTITFLLNNVGYEINYNGDILWKAPDDGKVSGDTIEHYHHEFTKLANGHYMILGGEFPLWKLPANADSNLLLDFKTIRDSVHNGYYQKVEFGTIIEYDEKGNVVWTWRSSEYFHKSDIKDEINAIGKFKDVHENSFYFDEQNKLIYVSFRNISRILKIHYPDGQVISTYGDKYSKGVVEMSNALFCNQHSCKLSRNGSLYLFNNNCCNKGAHPTVIMMQEDHNTKGGLKKRWEFDCLIEDFHLKRNLQFRSGGNVVELPDNAMLVSLSTDLYSNVFIVNRDKKILWSAIPEKWNQIETKWEPVFQYRANIITGQKEKEQLIWNGAIN